MIRILMADDHAILREGLKQLFTWAGDIIVTSEAINGQQVLEQLNNINFDLILLDLTMPEPCGVELIAMICARGLQIPILVLTMHNDPQIAKKAKLAGASGYLTKDSDPEFLLAAIRKVAAGGQYFISLPAEPFEIATKATAYS